MPKQIYRCEKCEAEFDKHNDCIRHEIKCLEEQDLISIHFNAAISQLVEKYQLEITEKSASLWVNESQGFISKFVQVNVRGTLSNGNEFEINEPYWKFEDTSEQYFKQTIEQVHIFPFLQTRYEGVLQWSHEGYWLAGGSIEMEEILRRFTGKKIRIEIVT